MLPKPFNNFRTCGAEQEFEPLNKKTAPHHAKTTFRTAEVLPGARRRGRVAEAASKRIGRALVVVAKVRVDPLDLSTLYYETLRGMRTARRPFNLQESQP